MRKVWSAIRLDESNYSAPKQHVLDMSVLNGGLNTWELEYKLAPNQSPDLLNVCWKDGSLSSRKGQDYIYEPLSEDDLYGAFHACYSREWRTGYIVAHKGKCLYEINIKTGVHTLRYSGLSEQGGSFFVFSDKLYYLNGKEYVQMDTNGVVGEVERYIPTVVMNRNPDGTGGDQYQPENRLSSGKGVWFTADGTSVNYVLPYQDLEETSVIAIVNGVRYTERRSYTSTDEFPETGNDYTLYFVNTDQYFWSAANSEYEQIIVYTGESLLDRTTPVGGYAYATSEDTYWVRVATPGEVTASGKKRIYVTEMDPASLSVTVNASAAQINSFTTTYPDGQTFTLGNGGIWYNESGVQVNLSDYSIGANIAGVGVGAYFHIDTVYYNPLSKFKPQFTVNRTTGIVTFDTAPSQTSPVTVNNVKITCFKGDEATKQSILGCTCATVYGSGSTLAVVCGGNPAQPNAYFWSGNTSVSLDPGYFPFDYYNFAGQADEYITGFGKQQNMLVILKERSIGKAHFEIETISSRDYLRLSYTPINDIIGCNLPKTIQLVENNLVFANTYEGVHILLDTSAAGENNIIRLSRNINGPDDAEYGLLYDARSVSADVVTSFDDGKRYWITAAGHAYLWDYTISSYRSKEEKLSWFMFDNIAPVCWFSTEQAMYYGRTDGALVTFISQFSDFGEPMIRRFTFATQAFGTYEVLKDVLKVIFAVRADTDTLIHITYRTDYEKREDLTPINTFSYRLVPRNLSYRNLNVIVFAGTAVRMPRCFHIRHFSMTLENHEINRDMSVISAQIVYRYRREDR